MVRNAARYSWPVNIILFEPDETGGRLDRSDPRAAHILDVLRREPGDSFDAGIVNGPIGKGTLVAVADDTLELAFCWQDTPPALEPITLIVGLPRPQAARRILQEATTLGAAAIHFVLTDKGDANYASSALWHSGEWRRHLIAGAQQAFTTRLPEVSTGRTLAELLRSSPFSESLRLALDNYEGSRLLGNVIDIKLPMTLALGSERGWSAGERRALRQAGFELVHLGTRVLRTETACIAALALVRARLGLM